MIHEMSSLIEAGFSLSLLANAILFIPQAFKLYRAKSAKGLSLLTFAGFNIIQLFTILHGYLQKDYILATGYMFSLITCGICTLMIIIYRNNYTHKVELPKRNERSYINNS